MISSGSRRVEKDKSLNFCDITTKTGHICPVSGIFNDDLTEFSTSGPTEREIHQTFLNVDLPRHGGAECVGGEFWICLCKWEWRDRPGGVNFRL